MSALFLILIKALMALIFRSFNPEVISPEGVIRNPKYLYCLVVEILLFPNEKGFLMRLPFLLNSITFVLSIFKVSPFLSAYNYNVFSILFNPICDLDNKRMSAAHIMQPRGSPCLASIGSFSNFSILPCRSARNMLNKSGLNMHPCLCPYEGVCYPISYFTCDKYIKEVVINQHLFRKYFMEIMVLCIFILYVGY